MANGNPNLLNLDDLTTPDVKSIVLDGKTFKALPLTVQEYIDRLQKAETLKVQREAELHSGKNEEEIKVDQAIELLTSTYKGLERKHLIKLDLAKLAVLIGFTLAAPKDLVEQIQNDPDTVLGDENPPSAEGNV